ncbi:MAG: uroporphyrinogen-III synthase [Alphaproteobacteria bacterium]
MILITRPRFDAELLAIKLNSLSLNYIIEPIMDIKFYSNFQNDLRYYLNRTNIIIITSKNSLRAAWKFIPKNSILNIVGEKTAEYARELGFNNISIVANDVNSLVKNIINQYAKNTGFIYLSGKITTIDLVKTLASQNFNIYKLVTYEAVPIKTFSKEAIDSFEKNLIDIVLFFSEKTAEYFLNLAMNSNLVEKLGNINAITISQKVTNTLSGVKWKNFFTASCPSEDSIIKLIKEEIYGK